MPTVVVLGAAYAGRIAVKVLADKLPQDWRLVMIDRNTHFNHVYVFPRFTVLSHHAPKAFVPYTHTFDPPTPDTGLITPPLTPPVDGLPEAKNRVWIHGNITSLAPNQVTYTRLSIDGEACEYSETISFDYCIYALGASLPAPVDTWTTTNKSASPLGSKSRGVAFMQHREEVMKQAKSVVVVGGGALGIQLATDLKDWYPEKSITLIHSRTRLMPIYPPEMHDGIVARLAELQIAVVLGERVVSWPSNSSNVLVTSSGREIVGDLILPCTGQKPHTALMADLSPSALSPVNGRIRVKPTLQVDVSGLEHIFATGDCADTGSIQAGHTAYWQGNRAAENIAKLANRGPDVALDTYEPTPPAIKVTLGKTFAITSNTAGTKTSDEGVEDLHAPVIWTSHGFDGKTFDI